MGCCTLEALIKHRSCGKQAKTTFAYLLDGNWRYLNLVWALGGVWVQAALMEKEAELEDKLTANCHILINVATEADFKKRCPSRRATDLVNLDSVKKYRLRRDATFEEFRSLVSPHPLLHISFNIFETRCRSISRSPLRTRGTGCGSAETEIPQFWEMSLAA